MDPTSAVAGLIGTRSPGLPGVRLYPVHGRTGFVVRLQGKRRRSPGAGRDVQRGWKLKEDRARPPLQGKWCRRGDVQRHGVVYAATLHHQRHGVVRSRVSPHRSDKGLALEGGSPTDSEPSRGFNPDVDRRTGNAVHGRTCDTHLGARQHDCRTEDPDEERPEHHVAQRLHPPGSCVVRHQPPDAQNGYGDDDRGRVAARSCQSTHGLGVAVASRIASMTCLACPMLSSPSSSRMRWARQPMATAFTSAGDT